MKRILIVGSGSRIAQALISYWQNQGAEVLALGRKHCLVADQSLALDMTDAANIPLLTKWLQNQDSSTLPDAIIVCYGLLHTADQGPEKNLNQFNDAFFLQNVQVNILAHVHVAQAVQPLLHRNTSIRWMSLSAMVGSISDNQLGGWYSYRMSKAALNMFIKTLSIEWQRKAPQSIVVATHPGTTDTALSAPFQHNLSADKLYTPTQTAERLSQVLLNLQPENHGHLLHWDGSELGF